MTDQALAIVTQKHSIINNFDDLTRAAGAMSKSGYFADSREQAQAIVKIMAGQELGFGPFASMTGVHIIQGKPTIGANLMASAVKASGKYNYRIVVLNDTTAEIEFFEQGKSIGSSKFTIEDARKANLMGKGNWQNFPRNMLFSRAMSNGTRWYCPDVFNGASVYTPEELGADVNADGDVIAGSWKDAEPEKATENTEPTTPATTEETPVRPYAPEVLKTGIVQRIKNKGNVTATEKQSTLLVIALNKCFAGETEPDKMRHTVTKYITGKDSTKDMTGAEIIALIDWLKPEKDSGGDYVNNPLSVKEAYGIVRQSLVDAGQGDLFAATLQPIPADAG